MRDELERTREELRRYQQRNQVQDRQEVVGDNGARVNQVNRVVMPRNEGGCSFKTFLTCNPPEFEGSTDPTESQRWIRGIQQAFDSCDCDDAHKVVYAIRMLKGKALDWWDTVSAALGQEAVNNLTWAMFIERFNEDHCTRRDRNKMIEEFLTLKKGDMTVAKFASKFVEKLKFARKVAPDEEEVVNRFLAGLPAAYRSAVRRATTLNEAIQEAKIVEDDLVLEEQEKRAREEKKVSGEKRKWDEKSGSSTRSEQTKKDTGAQRKWSWCSGCNSMHTGKCTKETQRCFRCGDKGHLGKECTSKDPLCYTYRKMGHISTDCPQKKDDGIGGGNKKKNDAPRNNGSVFQLTGKEAI
ncbi:uncharacterized protein LOC110919327 [Helianthus annuus]|uniref:uncharacterized protein LOC110919327 n=1 Tax=Helianthus annuus TaxID=4232 RepID=UPI000B8F82E3|nr:uncharacterized protein LOC110919327 [Helianthus annuus]